MDRYGEAIEWDLRAVWQVDIHDYFRGARPWRQLVRFLNGLPRTSRFSIAKSNDPEMAMRMARAMREMRAKGTPLRWKPPAEEWDTRAELEAKIVDRLGELVALVADLPVATDKHGKPKKRTKPPKATPRPESGVERADDLLAQQAVAEIVADVEAAYVTEEEYARIAAEVEEARAAAAAQPTEAVTSPEGQQPGD